MAIISIGVYYIIPQMFRNDKVFLRDDIVTYFCNLIEHKTEKCVQIIKYVEND
jgi:hypothetical protein